MNMSAKTVVPPDCYHATAINQGNGNWHCPNCRRFFYEDPRPQIEFNVGDTIRLADARVGRRRMKVGELGKILEINPLDPFPIKVQFESKKAATCVRPQQIELVSNDLVSHSNELVTELATNSNDLVAELITNSSAVVEVVTDSNEQMELSDLSDLTDIIGTAEVSENPEAEWLLCRASLKHSECATNIQQALYAARECGQLLLEARRKCRHGEWLKILDREFSGSRRNAYNYIAIAENWEELIEPNYEQTGNLSIDRALKLISGAKNEANLQTSANLDDENGGMDEAQNGNLEQFDCDDEDQAQSPDPQLELDSAIDSLIDHDHNADIDADDHDHDGDSEVLELDGFKVGDRFHAPPYVGELIAIIPEQTRPFRIDWQDWKILDYELADLKKWTRIEPETSQPPVSEGDNPPAGNERDRRRQLMTSSNTDEHYTPREVIDAVIQCFGGEIDLDPCSNSADPDVANVPANHYFTKDDNGLSQEWQVNSVYCNPPYSEVAAWVKKIVDEYGTGNCTELLLLVKADTSTRWFKQIWRNSTAVCFIDHRLGFINESNDGGKATFPSAIAYFGNDLAAFWAAFSPLGAIVQCITGDMLIDEYGQMAG